MPVWFSEDRTRFFVVPMGFEVAAGPLVLHNLRGQTVSVDPGGLADQEISREQAAVEVKAEFASAMELMRSSFQGLGAVVGQQAAQADPARYLTMFTEILGVRIEDALTDPEATRRAVEARLAGQDGQAAVQELARKLQAAVHAPAVVGELQRFALELEAMADRLSAADPGR